MLCRVRSECTSRRKHLRRRSRSSRLHCRPGSGTSEPPPPRRPTTEQSSLEPPRTRHPRRDYCEFFGRRIRDQALPGSDGCPARGAGFGSVSVVAVQKAFSRNTSQRRIPHPHSAASFSTPEWPWPPIPLWGICSSISSFEVTNARAHASGQAEEPTKFHPTSNRVATHRRSADFSHPGAENDQACRPDLRRARPSWH